MSNPNLDDLRRRIDAIDDRLHDLLMQRAEIVEAIAASKRLDAAPALRPGREAAIVRRLVARHSGHFPPAALVRMWREMFAAMVGMQAGFAVAVYVGEAGNGYWDLARDHFGSHSPMTPYNSLGQVIRALTEGQANVGIFPMPQEDDRDPWWRFIVSSDETAPRILARLPFAGRGNARNEGGDALVVGGGKLDPTGADRSFVAVETRGDLSRARIFAALGAASLDCTFFASYEATPETRLNLLDLSDFLTATDSRLQRFREHIGGAAERIVVLGGYAVPLGAGSGGQRASRP